MTLSTLIPQTVQPLPNAAAQLLHGVVVSAPDDDARIRIILPAFDLEQEFGSIPFMPRAIGAPEPGDLCLVAFNEQGDPWVVAFEAPDAADRVDRAIPRLSDLEAPTGPVAMGNQKLTGLAAGTASSDAVRKSQLDTTAAAAAAAQTTATAAGSAAATAAAAAAAAQTTADAAQATADAKPALFAATITGDSATTDFPVDHGLGSTDVLVQVWPDDGAARTLSRPDGDTVQVSFTVAPATGVDYRVIIIG